MSFALVFEPIGWSNEWQGTALYKIYCLCLKTFTYLTKDYINVTVHLFYQCISNFFQFHRKPFKKRANWETIQITTAPMQLCDYPMYRDLVKQMHFPQPVRTGSHSITFIHLFLWGSHGVPKFAIAKQYCYWTVQWLCIEATVSHSYVENLHILRFVDYM